MVNSGGGDVSAALDIADRILKNHLNIIVDGICISSCANYMFVVGASKIVTSGSLLGFHGGPAQTMDFVFKGPRSLYDSAFIEHRKYIKTLLERENSFFQHANVNISLLYDRPNNLPDNHRLINSFWVYSLPTLEKYGIKNIISYSDPGDRNVFNRIISRVIGYNCNRIDENSWLCS